MEDKLEQTIRDILFTCLNEKIDQNNEIKHATYLICQAIRQQQTIKNKDEIDVCVKI